MKRDPSQAVPRPQGAGKPEQEYRCPRFAELDRLIAVDDRENARVATRRSATSKGPTNNMATTTNDMTTMGLHAPPLPGQRHGLRKGDGGHPALAPGYHPPAQGHVRRSRQLRPPTRRPLSRDIRG
jgi:hypothetical protein